MRLLGSTVARVLLGVGVAAVLTLTVYGSTLLRRERADLREARSREMLALGTALRVAVEHAVRDVQFEDIERTLDSLQVIDDGFSARVLRADGTPWAADLPRSTSPERDRLYRSLAQEATSTAQPVLRFSGADGLTEVHVGLALRTAADATSPIGANATLVLTRSLADVRRDLRTTTLLAVVSTAGVLVVIVIVGLLLGHRYVGRPIAALSEAVRSVKGGDLRVHVAPDGSGDVGSLTTDFNAMVDALARARAELDAVTESRRLLERGLQDVDKLVTVGQLATTLAHEIGSPLQVVHGRVDGLISSTPLPHDEVQRLAHILKRQTERIIRIVDQLLRVGRRVPVQVTEVDVREVVRHVAEFVHVLAARRGVALAVPDAPDVPDVPDVPDAPGRTAAPLPPLTVRGDADRLQQVVLNLLTNAITVCDRGGRVWVTVDTATLPTTTRVADAVRIVVHDDGPGMSTDVADQVFTPFFSTRLAQGGAGLGLTVVKTIVTEHGGQVSVSSTPGRGSAFTVLLPVDGPAWANAREQQAHDAPASLKDGTRAVSGGTSPEAHLSSRSGHT